MTDDDSGRKENSVRRFYDERGWRKADDTYVDTQLYGDHRPFVQAYIARSKARVAAALGPSGRLFLDLGCGAKPEAGLSGRLCATRLRRFFQGGVARGAWHAGRARPLRDG